MNRIIQEDQTTEKKPVDQEALNLTERVKRLADYDFRIKPDQIMKQVPFIIYLCVLVFFYIYNSHRSEKIIRETDKLNKEVKDLRSEYITELSELMNESKQSEVAAKLQPYGIKELKTPPSKITYRAE